MLLGILCGVEVLLCAYSCELFAELPTAKLLRVADGKV